MARTKAAPWGNRILSHGTMRAGDFLANPENWRTHGLAQEAQLTSLLDDVGFVGEVMVNKRTHASWPKGLRGVETMVDGHLRVKAALARGEDTPVPYFYVDLTPEEERRVLLTLDPIGAMAGRDDDLLAGLRTQVETEWPDSIMDIDVLIKPERKRSKGLTHEVHECTCCKAGCAPGCGCYRGD